MLPVEDMSPYTTAFYRKHLDPAHRAGEKAIGRALRDHLHPVSVIDFGCGLGNIVVECGADYNATWGVENPHRFDQIASVGPLLSLERYQFFDLRQSGFEPVYLRGFDLAICVEVAEHLPKESAGVLIDTLTNASGKVFFSSAIPGQSGEGHINCQPNTYWDELFFRRGFYVDDRLTRTIVWEYAGAVEKSLPWYLNARLYRRQV